MDTYKKNRCNWCLKDPIYVDYHDREWGVPIYNDMKIFESLFLETFQSGLSWITILKKRKNFRKSFSNFDYEKISFYTNKKLESLMLDESIIRNRLKIHAAKTNANAFIKIRSEFNTFSEYIWKFTNMKPINNKIESQSQIPINTILSDKISADLKKRGFKFVGSTTVYAFMQAIGMVNDHTTNCFRYKEISMLDI
tara:strand:+ start:127 stop:714 length:588 start_codon:yes stop_codon:yes gene_type:complete